MVLRASRRYRLRAGGLSLGALDAEAPITLSWPRWYPESASDRHLDAQTLTTLVEAGLLSRETAGKFLAPTYDVADVAAELGRPGV